MDVFATVVTWVFTGLIAVLILILLLHFLVGCWSQLAEERRAAERWAELEWQSLAAAPPAPVEVELVRPVPVVVKLGYFPYSAEGRRASEKLVCAICLEVFEHEEKCSEVPACRHLFHRDCIDVWMKTKTTCPLCRGDIGAASDQLSAAEDMV